MTNAITHNKRPSAKNRDALRTPVANSDDVLMAAPRVVPSEAPRPSGAPARKSKLTQLVVLLEAKEGTTIEAMCAATGWQAHSVRGAMAGTLKRKGYVVASLKPKDGPRRYHIGETA